MIKKYFSENPLLYKVYFYLKRKHTGVRVKFFNKETDLYFDGYPRSGNTFMQKLINTCFPEVNTVHHLHLIAPVKIALKKKIPTFILIRNPYECISSYYLKYYSSKEKIPDEIDLKLLKNSSNNYLRYYRFVDKSKNDVNIIHFDDLISSPYQIIKKIENKLETGIPNSELIKRIEKAKSDYKGATDVYGSSKPNRIKELEKGKLKKALEVIPELENAFELYKNLI